MNEEKNIRPKLSKAAEEVIKNIRSMNPDITRNLIIELIETEVTKAAGLLTEEAAAYLVASDLSTNEEEPKPAEGEG